MKRSVLLLLVVEAGLAMAVFGQAQVVVPPRARFPQHQPHKLRQQGLTPLLAQPSLLPAMATRDVIQVNCPVEAQALGAVCGYVPVPLHRDRPSGELHRDRPNGETINIYFEIYAHSNPGPAQSAIVPNAGGPSLTTSGLRFLWLGLFGANLDAHDLLLIDDRGRGMSALIDCQELQHGTGSFIDHEAADCAAQLGDDDSSYGTGDVALDVEAVRAALGYEKLDYYGGSYGAMDASAYATRFGEHLRSVILDSPAGPRSLVPFVQRYSTAAVPRAVHLDCLRSPTCGVDHPNPDTELDWLIGTVRSKPVQGVAHDANGNPVNVDFNEIVLTQIATNPNFGYLDIGELLAAGESLRRGDDLPLLRLGAEAFTPIVSDFGDPALISTGAYAATWCVDNLMPFRWSSPPRVRLIQYAEAVSALPPDYFAPFSKAASTGVDILGDRDCVFWEEPSPPAPVIPAGAKYPKMPTLAFNSDIDPAVPTELAIRTVALFPESTLLIVMSGMHEPVESNQCAASIAANFIETLEAGDTSCTQGPEIVWPALGRFPLFARDARAAEVDPSGKNEIDVPERRVVTVAVETGLDALKRSTIGIVSLDGNIHGVGLRAGTFRTSFDANGNQTTTLTNCAFANDVTVNGTLLWRTDRSMVAVLTVSGSGTAGGTLHIEGAFEASGPVGNFKISGMLGARQVAALVPEG